MTNREVAEIVRAAERLGLDELDRAREILDRGVTVAEYRRYEMRRTARWVAVCLVVALSWCAACAWAVRTYAPQATEAEGRG